MTLESPLFQFNGVFVSDKVKLYDFFKWISQLLDVTTINFTPAGLSVHDINPTHHCSIYAMLSRNLFNEYSLDTPLSVRVNITDIERLLKHFSVKAEPIAIRILKNKLCFEARKITFDLALLATDDERPPAVLNLTFQVTTTLKTKDLADFCKFATKYGDYVTFEAKEDILTLTVSGDLGTTSRAFPLRLDSPLKTSQSAYYLLDYINNICKIDLPRVIIAFSQDMPMKFSFPIVNGSALDFYLAPKVDEDDDDEKTEEEGKAEEASEKEHTNSEDMSPPNTMPEPSSALVTSGSELNKEDTKIED
jgi:proliferating cell nuclear antigen